MRNHRKTLSLALLFSLGGALVAAGPAQGSPSPAPDPGDPVAAMRRVAHPLLATEPGSDTGDLRPLGRMIGGARVVGLGEATHNSHEFFTLKDRVFRYLVEEKGFRAFALEAPWSTGQRLDAYVVHGKGEPRQIMREEFQDDYKWWNTKEYLDVIEWMRAYNVAHPGDPVRFVGNDIAYAGPELYDKVVSYIQDSSPELVTRFTELYSGLRPTTDVGTYMNDYRAKPLKERREIAGRTGTALALLKKQRPGPGASAKDRAAYTWAVQNATAVDQTATGWAFDQHDKQGHLDLMRFRDRAMANNTAWWQQHTGDKVMLSAHDAHVAYETFDPKRYPKTQGAFLKEALGSRYLSIGSTFEQGSFNSSDTDGKVRKFTVGMPDAGTNEATLEKVRGEDYMLDMRTAPATAHDWLSEKRGIRWVGTGYPEPPYKIALADFHDVLVHLHRVRAADLVQPSS